MKVFSSNILRETRFVLGKFIFSSKKKEESNLDTCEYDLGKRTKYYFRTNVFITYYIEYIIVRVKFQMS